MRTPANELHITPGVSQNSLLSTVKYADANYITVFDKDEVNIYDANDTVVTVSKGAILRGWRDTNCNLWRIPLVNMVRNLNTDTVLTKRPPSEFLQNRPDPTEAVHSVYELKTQPELVRYLHAATGFPTKPTWIRAIKNKHFASWPGLTVDAVRRHFPDSDETHKGHGRRTPSGIRSTRAQSESTPTDDSDNTGGLPPATKEKTIFHKVYDLEEEATHKIWTDQTGRFPKMSSRGSQYIMVLTESDSSAILVEPMKNRSSGEMIRAYQALIARLNSAGIFPKEHILDNECSADFKAIIKTNKMSYQLVPPHDHRRNRAEKAIQTFKAHFIAILCGTDPSFPLHLWDRLLAQAEHTLNMLRPARMLKTISAHTYLWGQHNYNSNPYAPLGCKVEAHVVPEVRETWAPHTATGYYIGNANEHYRCHTIYITNTKSTRTCSSVFFKPPMTLLQRLQATFHRPPSRTTPSHNYYKCSSSKQTAQTTPFQLKGCSPIAPNVKGCTTRRKPPVHLLLYLLVHPVQLLPVIVLPVQLLYPQLYPPQTPSSHHWKSKKQSRRRTLHPPATPGINRDSALSHKIALSTSPTPHHNSTPNRLGCDNIPYSF